MLSNILIITLSGLLAAELNLGHERHDRIEEAHPSGNLSLGSLERQSSHFDDFSTLQSPERSNLPATALTTDTNRESHQITNSPEAMDQVGAQATKPTPSISSQRKSEPLSTDCRAKRAEIVHRQKLSGPSSSSVRNHTIRLRPKQNETPNIMALLNETSTNGSDGEHVPSCNSRGGYQPIQCHKIGYCWCVNKYGQAIKNSAVPGGEELYCDPRMYESDSDDYLVVAGISAHRIKNLLKNGYGSTSESTTPNGNMNFDTEALGESHDSETGRPQSTDEFGRRNEPTLPLIPNDCKLSRANAQDRAIKHINDNIWVPDCDQENEDLYAEKQCHKTRICWCVDKITGLPLRTRDQLTVKSGGNCSEIRRIIESSVNNPIRQGSVTKPLQLFYHGSSEFCDTERRIEFVASLNNQFRQHISDYLRQNPTNSLPNGLSSINPFTISESLVSKLKFSLMDKDMDNKLGDREWSKFKMNLKLVDKIDEMDNPSKQQRQTYSSLPPLLILRSQRKCWRDFIEFCSNGEYLSNDESINLTKWLSCTDLPPKTSSDPKASATFSENTYAHSREAAIVRSRKKNPFLGILKPD